MAEVKFTKAIFGNTDILSAQAFVFSRDNFILSENPASSKNLGTVYLALIISAIGEDIFTKVRQFSMALEDRFFDSDEPIATRLDQALDFLQQNLTDAQSLSALLVFWQENALYLKSLGSNAACLLREDKIINLSKDSEGQLVSGFVNIGDRLLLISGQFPSELNTPPEPDRDQKLINRLIYSPLDELEENLHLTLTDLSISDPCAVILFDNQEVSSQLPTESPPPAPNKIEDFAIHHIADDQSKNKLNEWESANFLNGVSEKSRLNLKTIAKKLIPKTRRSLIYTGLSLILLSLILFGLTQYLKKQSTQKAQIQNLISEAKTRFESAKNEKESDPEAAKKDFDSAKSKLDQALKLDPKSSSVKNLQSEIDKSSQEIFKVTQITDWPLFLSLDLIKSGFSTSRLSYSLGTILMLDPNQKTLLTLDLDKKTNQILAGQPQLGNAQFASLNGENAVVYSADKGLLRIDTQTKKLTQVSKPDSDWGRIADIFAFSSNVYALDEQKNQIYKYIAAKSGYSDKVNYLKEGTNVSLGGSKRMQIDYSVWVLKIGPEILRFTAGAPDNFSIGGLDKPIGSTIPSLFVSEDQDIVYILDRDNSRLVLLKKSGQYISQYLGDKFKTADDLIFDQNSKKLYLLDSNKLYAIELK